jgi:hypothetical protein
MTNKMRWNRPRRLPINDQYGWVDDAVRDARRQESYKIKHVVEKPQPFPVDVSVGANPDGSLKLLRLHSREEADAAGFEWVGR